jgi:hypothetical protein
VRAAVDEDFDRVRALCECHDGWRQDYNKGGITVWTKSNDVSSFKMVKIRGVYPDVTGSSLYDVLHDPVYRKTWDPNIIEGQEVCRIDGYNDIGYYAMHLPKPLANRDFLTQRSWKDMGKEKIIFNHSVAHAAVPVKRSFVRGLSYMTGYHIIVTSDSADKPGCQVTYLTQSDPKGSLPVWVVNKATQWLAPKVMVKLHKACLSYNEWKATNEPDFKPWLFPEQSTLPLLNPADILSLNNNGTADEIIENEIQEDECSEDSERG